LYYTASGIITSVGGRKKLYYTASGIITPVGGRPVHTCVRDGHLQSVTIPDAV